MMRMRRVILSLRLACEAIVGVLLLANVPLKLAEYFTHSGPGPTIATVIGTTIGIVLVWDALRLRRLLNKAQPEPLAPAD